MAQVFITGGTGYMGRRLIPALLARGHDVLALVRPGSEARLPSGATPIVGDVLKRGTFEASIPRGATVVHLVGTPHPSPAKAAEFEAVDFVSARECHAAATHANAGHFIYVSVAHPAPIMHAYVAVRERVEGILQASSLPHTILRPWYVLGPGHRWAYVLAPMYWIAALMPSRRDTARRLGLVTLPQMIATLTHAVDTAGNQRRSFDVPDIRRMSERPSS
jgi:uncharacterized protein YbjT (DUF2867 family)